MEYIFVRKETGLTKKGVYCFNTPPGMGKELIINNLNKCLTDPSYELVVDAVKEAIAFISDITFTDMTDAEFKLFMESKEAKPKGFSAIVIKDTGDDFGHFCTIGEISFYINTYAICTLELSIISSHTAINTVKRLVDSVNKDNLSTQAYYDNATWGKNGKKKTEEAAC